MPLSPRQRFLYYVRDPQHHRQVVSPFLPDHQEICSALQLLGEPIAGDPFADEITLARRLDYEPMFMTDFESLLFPWRSDPDRSDEKTEVRVIDLPDGEWVYRKPRGDSQWNEETACPVQSEADHQRVVQVCEQITDREGEIRTYFREFRRRVGEDGVIVLGHPHPSWLCSQINPQEIFFHWNDYPAAFRQSMNALFRASLFIVHIAIEEGIDFMSDSSYGLEMTSPELFREMDLPYIQALAFRTHELGGLFWYHNCGDTRQWFLDGTMNSLGADVIETVAPPPEGDNDLRESRQALDRRICSKGNLSLTLLRDGTPEQVEQATRRIIEETRGFPHIVSTADGVLPGTPPENFIAFVQAARQ